MDTSPEPATKKQKVSHGERTDADQNAQRSSSSMNEKDEDVANLPDVSSLLPSEPCTAAEGLIESNSADEAAPEFEDTAKSEPSEHDGNQDDEQEKKTNFVDKEGNPISKSAWKKLQRKERHEATKSEFKAKKKAAEKAKKAAKREAAREAAGSNSEGVPGATVDGKTQEPKARPSRQIPVPISLVLDCSFDSLMNEQEIVSLSQQMTRCYADIRSYRRKPLLAVSSWGGRLKERNDTVTKGQYKSWRGVVFGEEDWVSVAQSTASLLTGTLDPAHDPKDAKTSKTNGNSSHDVPLSIVYLTSDSPHTLETLAPNTAYIIGGLVDRNRHKGICYKRARDRGADSDTKVDGVSITTAKLPIGEFMRMSSRFVLTTNQVAEIMLAWLDTRDWGEAFLKVIPKRKGGELKKEEKHNDADGDGEKEDHDHAVES